jgi:hypothetical protein
MVTVHVPVPEQAPPQPVNVDPADGVADSVIFGELLDGYVWAQLAAQEMLPVPLTLPPPVPPSEIVSLCEKSAMPFPVVHADVLQVDVAQPEPFVEQLVTPVGLSAGGTY